MKNRIQPWQFLIVHLVILLPGFYYLGVIHPEWKYWNYPQTLAAHIAAVVHFIEFFALWQMYSLNTHFPRRDILQFYFISHICLLLLLVLMPIDISFVTLMSGFLLSALGCVYYANAKNRVFSSKLILYSCPPRVHRWFKRNDLLYTSLEKGEDLETISADSMLIVADNFSLEDVEKHNLSGAFLDMSQVRSFSAFVEFYEGRLLFDDRILLELSYPSKLVLVTKTLIDKLLAAIILPFAMLAIVIAGIAIKLDSQGPIFYKQQRYGLHMKFFWVWKLRTMFNLDPEIEFQATLESDERITKVGKFLRKYRLDELPQFFNVLFGSMSLIGPRPLIGKQVEDIAMEEPWFRLRFALKPGITGWAQVKQGYTTAKDKEENLLKCQYDLFYLKRVSFWFDILILIRTLRVVFSGFGSR